MDKRFKPDARSDHQYGEVCLDRAADFSAKGIQAPGIGILGAEAFTVPCLKPLRNDFLKAISKNSSLLTSVEGLRRYADSIEIFLPVVTPPSVQSHCQPGKASAG